jgi:DNA primase
MLCIPYMRYPVGQDAFPVTVRFRCLADHNHKDQGHGKYNTLAGDTSRLFNTRSIVSADDEIAITEGELDAITAVAAGIPAVGVSGADAWQAHFAPAFYGYHTVWVFADGDPAGVGFGRKVSKELSNSRVVTFPPGEDVNSLVLAHGPNRLKELLDG